MDLQGRTVIVTGSGTGIGQALALEFARQGTNVVCCARREAPIRETVSLIEQEGGTALAISTDVTRGEQVRTLVEQTLSRFGNIDVLFNNAGSFQAIGGLWEVAPDLWWRDVTVNLLGPMLCARAVLPHMMRRNEGIIVNMYGGGAVVPLAGGSGYGCSKAALLRLTDTLARELETVGSAVLVFAMGPGLVRTEMTEYQVETPEGRKWLPGTKEAFDKRLDRPPEDCAQATIKLIRIARPELNGRIFGPDDDYEQIAAQAAEIRQQDRKALRMKW